MKDELAKQLVVLLAAYDPEKPKEKSPFDPERNKDAIGRQMSREAVAQHGLQPTSGLAAPYRHSPGFGSIQAVVQHLAV